MADTDRTAVAAELIRERRTINRFRSEVPPQEVVLKALDLARWAPNHHLTEPWRFYLLGRETATAIAHLNADMVAQDKGPEAAESKRANWLAKPGWLVVTCVSSDDVLQAWEDYAACCCAIQNLMLYLWSEGVGSKWSTGPVIRDPRFHDLIWVDPEVETVVGLLWYGYPDESPQPPRRPLPEVLIELP
ncbi:MAG: nitroreductase [Candidatus Competibacterales bacterium]|nr:nitroreductase [Candidatus Competibacterales bacterium]